MAKTILGKVGMTPKGAYNNTTEYVRLDVVTKNGQSYVCIKNCSGKDVTNTTYWQLIASKGEMPVNGVDYNTEEDKQAFKEAVVEDSKTEMDNYTADKKEELDTHTIDKKTELNNYKKDLEDEMSTTKENLVEDINNATTENINEFNSNAETKTNAFNDNVTEKTTNYNTNTETKLKEYNDNSASKLKEYNDNTIVKLEEYSTNATNKVNEFNENVDSLENELTELAEQMPWNTTEIQDSINVNDSAKYSRNKLGIFGNLVQETSVEGRNICPTDFSEWELGQWDSVTGEKSNHNNRLRVKRLIKVEPSTAYYYDLFWSKPEGETLDAVVLIRKYDINKNFIGVVSTYLNKGIHTTSSDEYYISITLGQGGQNFTWTYETFKTFFENGIIKPLWCLNSETDKTFTEYIPNKPSMEYPSTPVVATGVQKIIKCESNLYNVRDKREASAVYSVSDDDWITVTVDNSENSNITYKNFYRNASKRIKPNTKYYIVTEIKSVSGNGSIAVVSADSNSKGQFKNKVSYNFSDLTNNSIKIAQAMSLENLNNCVTMLRTFTTFTAGQSGSITFRLSLLEVEPTAETFVYKPYTEEVFELDLGTTELCKMMDSKGNIVAQDRAVYKDGKWQWEKNIVVHIVDKTVLQQTATSITGKYRYQYYPIKNNVVTAKDRNPGICNIFSLARDGQTFNCEKGFALITGTWNFYDEGETLKEFLTKIEDIDIVVVYITINPIYEDCTPAQSEVLDKLYKLSLEKGTNNIYVESENGVTTELQLTYMQDNNIRISNMQEQINALSKAVLDLGGNE